MCIWNRLLLLLYFLCGAHCASSCISTIKYLRRLIKWLIDVLVGYILIGYVIEYVKMVEIISLNCIAQSRLQ